MVPPAAGCPDEVLVARFVDGGGDDASRARIEAHLDVCPLCLELVGELARLMAESRIDERTTLPSTDPVGAGGGVLLRPGRSVNRYRIESVLGGGGMGVVYAARDLELDRKVAIKVVRPDRASAHGRERLMREARALARISHPNVVAVHDIGSIGDQIYIAMELVEGVNLRRWLESADRSWREIVAAFADAGRGLAAVHAAGLVHRDFKPENVLVGDDGAIRVADFGLAGLLGEPEPDAAELANASPTSRLTEPGAVLGTMRYMAPEQHRGEPATAASDQFSFCVSAYEALHGRHPFAAPTYRELRQNVESGAIQPPIGGGATPAWVTAALVRGMAAAIEHRHPSMAALLDRLTTDPRARARRRWRYAAAATVAIGLAAAAAVAGGRQVPCRGDDSLADVWAANRPRLRGLFGDAGRSDGYRRFSSAIDDHVAAWGQMRVEACEATHVRGTQSAALLDRRMICLDQRRRYLSQLFDVLGNGSTGEDLDGALRAAVDLPSLDHCADAERLLQVAAPPESAAERLRADALDRAIDRAQALVDLGALGAAVITLDAALAVAGDHPPTTARAYQLLGKATLKLGQLERAAAHLQRSIELATRAGDDSLVAGSWLALMYLEGVEQENTDRALELGELARLALLRGRGSELEFASLDRATAGVLVRKGKTAQAAELLDRARPVYEKLGKRLELADLLHTRGEVHVADKEFDRAIESYQRALAEIEAELGASHPEYANTLNNLGVALKNKRDYPAARQVLERCVRLVEASLGKTHRRMFGCLTNLGNVQQRSGDHAAAIASYERAIELGKVALGPTHPHVNAAMMNLAIVYSSIEQHERATALFRDVVDRQIAAVGPDHPRVALALNNLGDSLHLEGKYAEALVYLDRAEATKRRVYGAADHPAFVDTLALLGTVHGKLGDRAKATAALRRALTIQGKVAGDDDPLTITVLSQLGQLYSAAGAKVEAVPLLERAVAARERARKGGPITRDEAADRAALARARGRRAPRHSSRNRLFWAPFVASQ